MRQATPRVTRRVRSGRMRLASGLRCRQRLPPWAAPPSGRLQTGRAPGAPTGCASPRSPKSARRPNCSRAHIMAEVPGRGGVDGLLSKLATDLINGDIGVFACALRLQQQSWWLPPSLRRGVEVGPVGGHISVGGDATLLSSHAGRSFSPASALLLNANPRRQRKIEPDTGDPEPTTTHGTCHADTPQCGIFTLTLRRKITLFSACRVLCVCSR
jgi:hypothetical protein